jgi:hypothetical protein
MPENKPVAYYGAIMAAAFVKRSAVICYTALSAANGFFVKE